MKAAMFYLEFHLDRLTIMVKTINTITLDKKYFAHHMCFKAMLTEKKILVVCEKEYAIHNSCNREDVHKALEKQHESLLYLQHSYTFSITRETYSTSLHCPQAALALGRQLTVSSKNKTKKLLRWNYAYSASLKQHS